ncbi:MAG: pitrilysin family protein [Patescibacteria group bacterium]|jgi:predicted Zn-dependent peptidase
MYKHQKHILKNGIRFISIPMTDTNTVSVLILVKVGSRYETKETGGLSHFLEHMVFKGTKKRPTTLDISTSLDELGAEFNAFTGEELTGFYIKSQSKDFDHSLDILNDMLFNSLFDIKEIEREKGVITAELNMYREDPKLHVSTMGQELLYDDTPLGRDIGGTIETVNKFEKNNFLDYIKKHYIGKNIVVAVAGKQDNAWLENLKEKMEEIPKGDLTKAEIFKDDQKNPKIMLDYRKIDQANILLGFKTFSKHDSRKYALSVLSNILGGAMSSRLFITVRERHGLCYYIRSSTDFFEDTGDFVITSGIEPTKIDKAISLIIDEIKNIKTNKIDEKELNKAKENICGRFYLSLEESLEVANYYGSQELFFDKIEEPLEFARQIRKVTAEEVQNVARQIFDLNKINIALIGPYKDEKHFINLIK